jgi:HNH endonuclease
MERPDIFSDIQQLSRNAKFEILKFLASELTDEETYHLSKEQTIFQKQPFSSLGEAEAKLIFLNHKAKDEPSLVKAAAYGLLARYCWYCGRQNMRGDFIVEHQVPQSRGGSDEANNLVIACQSCNSTKRNKTVDEWKTEIAERAGIRISEVIFFGETEWFKQWEKGLMELIQMGRKTSRQPESTANTQTSAQQLTRRGAGWQSEV